MATIKPFRGVRYNTDKLDPSQTISQPYDRVRYGLQERYYALNPYNVVRLTRGLELDGDRPDLPEGPNVYTRARAYYELWHAEQVLRRDPDPAIYVYHQSFAVEGVTRMRKAFIAAFELSRFEQGIVLPHELTHAGPKLDRLRLLRALPVNLGQVFMLYPDPANQISDCLEVAVRGRKPDLEATDMYESDVRQRLWAVRDPETIRTVQSEMAGKRNLIIADGHHRYETALAYRDEMIARHPDAPPQAAFRYRMAAFVGMDDPGLVVLATHREVYDHPGTRLGEVLSRAEAVFRVTPVADLEACLNEMHAQRHAHAFGLYGDGRYHVLVLRHPSQVEQAIPEPRGAAWKSLDVTIAHRMILEPLVGLPASEAESGRRLRYHRDPSLAIENVDAGRGNLVLLLNPTPVAQIKACVEQGEQMPQKSTDFYPKLVSGLVMMPVASGERIE